MLANHGSSSRSHYNAPPLHEQLAPVAETSVAARDLSHVSRSSLARLLKKHELTLAFVFVAIASWAAWQGFAWLIEAWRIY